MPELPEVEAARRALESHCVGKRIVRCAVADDPKVIDGVSAAEFEGALVGRAIAAARRKGKNLWLELDSPPFPSFQFGMAGAIYIKGVAVTKYKRSAVSSSDEWPSKYSKVFVELEDGVEFSFTDKRRFARVRLLKDPESAPPISELGPDALFEPMQVDEFIESLGEKRIAIKALLLDQRYISGIGNWIADEVLYQAKIHPLQIAASMSKESCKELHRSVQEVIKYSVEVDADSSRFPVEWMFHYRWGKKPGKINGKKIEFIVAGGRTTAHVPEVQKLNRNQAGNTKATQSRKTRQNGYAQEESYGESEDHEKPKSTKSRKMAKASRGGKKQKKQIPTDSSDDKDSSEPATLTMRKEGVATRKSTRERADTSEGSAHQKRRKRGK